MVKLAIWGLVCISMAIVLWLRLMPLSLSGTDEWADRLIRRQLRARMAAQATLPLVRSRTKIHQQVQQWIEQHPSQFTARGEALSQSLKAERRYEGKDGRSYVYLAGRDSYTWLRSARNYLRSGTTCDAWIDDVCYDTYTLAPVGARAIYHRSLHIAALVGLHRLITWWYPAYPLPASAFLVPVIVGVLGVLPAFGIGWRLAGLMAGLVAALNTALHPSLLERSIGSDNDVWNVVLPLGMMWAAMCALTAPSRWHQVVYGLLASAFASLHASAWRGWGFAYLVLLTGLVAYVLFQALHDAIHQRTYCIWRGEMVRCAALVALVFYLGTGIGSMVAGAEASAFTLPFTALPSLIQSAWAAESPGAMQEHYMMSALNTVEELRQTSLEDIMRSMGGRYIFFGGLLGLLLALLPRDRWRWWHIGVLVGSGALYGGLSTLSELNRWELILLIALPLVTALLLRLIDADPDIGVGQSLILILWFLGATYLVDAKRFLLLLGPPFSLAFAVAVGRLYSWVTKWVSSSPFRTRIGAHALCWSGCALLLVLVIYGGIRITRNFTPTMHDAWWDTLTELRHESAPDAIVNTTWNYGYWVKYVAERRVSHDGASLHTHVPHWISRALVTRSERESLGVLRMLNCGSAATPLPEGERGAYGRILATGRDPLTAYTLVLALAQRDRGAARVLLANDGFTIVEQADILHASHCQPPESYLILSLALATRYLTAWTKHGLWDPRRAYITDRVRSMPSAKAVQDMMERLGVSKLKAEQIYAYVQRLKSEQQVRDYKTPAQWLMTATWLPCQMMGNRLRCLLGARIPAGHWFEAFVYDPISPTTAHFRVYRRQRDRFAATATEETPAVVLLAGSQHIEEIKLSSPTYHSLGVLVDVVERRVLVGTLPFLRSIYTHLIFLDGRYMRHYEKIKDKRTRSGDRVTTWKIRWPERE